jgi:hypothetical protein
LFLIAITGCTKVTVVDDIDIDLDFTPLTGPSDDLHQPYVAGSSMTLIIQSTDNHEKFQGWTLRSSDSSVFAVAPLQIEEHWASSAARALGVGVVQVDVLDGNSHVVHSRQIEVALPDRIALVAAGKLIIGQPESQSAIADLRMLAPTTTGLTTSNGVATVLARYYRGGQLLNGNGALSVESASGVVADVEQSYLFEQRDWLRVTAATPTTATVALAVGGTHVSAFTVEVVGESELASVRILGEDESHAHKGDYLVALAQASDGSGRDVFGVDYTWDLDGAQQLGEGDLYRYTYDPRQPKLLTARAGSLDATAMIHWGGGFVDSSNNIGCSTVPGRGGRFPIAAVALLAGIALITRRGRRRRARCSA